ncbi:hypothetical protein ACVBEF_12530 [Glaciimonas sp. GG7]
MLLLVVLIAAGVHTATKVVPPHDASLVQISLRTVAPIAPVPLQPLLVPPPQIPKSRPEQAPAPPVRSSPQATASPSAAPSIAPSQNPTNHPTPEVTAPVVAVASVSPAVADKPGVNISLEKTYYATLKAEVERQKVYPHSREASMEQPQGKVVVWLEVSRSGEVIASGIEAPASSMLLNRAAEGSLRRLKQVEKFPPEAFSGIDKKRFSVTFNYNNTTEDQHATQGE